MKNKIEIIYDLIIKGIKINKELLNIYNYTDEEINNLIKSDILKEEQDKYTLNSINTLYRYGIKLLLLGKIKKSKDCFVTCYRLEPTNREVCLQLMNIALKEKNYIGVSKMLNIIKSLEPENHIEDNKLYTYLVGILMNHKEEYKDYLKNIDLDELLLSPNVEYPDKTTQNLIRRYINDQRYKMALKLINDLIRQKTVYITELELLKELVFQTLQKDEKLKNNIKIAIKNQDYEQVIKLLSQKSETQYLNSKEIYIQMVTQNIIQISKTDKIPVITEYSTKFLYDAIKGNNFKLAKAINDQFLEETNQDIKEDSLHILLNDIISLTQNIEEDELMNKIQIEQENTPNENNQTKPSNIDLNSEEELALYILNTNITLEQARKKIGILPEQVQLIKLIFARYYYNEGTEESINKADKLINEVEINSLSTYKINNYLSELKNNRDTYIYSPISTYTKKKK